MTNDQNIVRGRHLDSLAADAKRFTLEQNLALNQAIQAELAELDTGTSYDVFTGATSITGGLSGLVPAPQAGDELKFLRGDGTWSDELVLPTVASSANGGFWLDVSGTPPAPKFYYDGTTYTFDVTVPRPRDVYFWDATLTKSYYDEENIPLGFEDIEIAGGYEITIPASVLNWTTSSKAFQDGAYITYALEVKRTSAEIDMLTPEQVTLSGYAPTNYHTSASSDNGKPFLNFGYGQLRLIWYTSQASYTEAQSAGSLTLTINNPKYDQRPLKINWGLAAGELMTAT